MTDPSHPVAAIPSSVRIFYRITRALSPTEVDFLSNEARRRAPPDNAEARALWNGISVYDTASAAEKTAWKHWPSVGRYIATLQIAEDATIVIKKTTLHPRHYTLWGDPLVFLECVQWVDAIADPRQT